MTYGSESGRRIAIAVSGCLLGDRVRYDGTDKRDARACEEFARLFDLLPVCPEVGIGLTVPRPPIDLVLTPDGTRARLRSVPARDVTDPLGRYADEAVRRLGGVISGYVFKARSPSCALRDAARRTEDGATAAHGGGVFAQHFLARLPGLPVADEVEIADSGAREDFIERVYAYERWRSEFVGQYHPGG